MSTFKDQLIRLGSKYKSLRSSIYPVLSGMDHIENVVLSAEDDPSSGQKQMDQLKGKLQNMGLKVRENRSTGGWMARHPHFEDLAVSFTPEGPIGGNANLFAGRRHEEVRLPREADKAQKFMKDALSDVEKLKKNVVESVEKLLEGWWGEDVQTKKMDGKSVIAIFKVETEEPTQDDWEEVEYEFVLSRLESCVTFELEEGRNSVQFQVPLKALNSVGRYVDSALKDLYRNMGIG